MEMVNDTFLARFLRKQRIDKGLTQVEIAKRLGYSSQFVANWERGVSRPPYKVLRKYMLALGASKSQIVLVHLQDLEKELKEVLNGKTKEETAR